MAIPAFAPPLIPESEELSDFDFAGGVPLEEANVGCPTESRVVGAAARSGMLLSSEVETAWIEAGRSVPVEDVCNVVCCWTTTGGRVGEVLVAFATGVLDATTTGLLETTGAGDFVVGAAFGVLDTC